MTNAIHFEHERRFVPDLKDLPFDYQTFPMKSIRQGYLDDELKTRLRDEYDIEGNHICLQTRKTGSGISRQEDECEISRNEFDMRWKNTTCSLDKTRYYIPWEGALVELNIFHGDLEGYAQIEVEFPTHEDAVAFIPPSWFGKEVTDDSGHGNHHLAKYGLPSSARH
ncbi:MAG: adenylate cyclase [Candidatus Paceibacterota bacterium]|jgi:CYTH domain-containing protein